MTTDQNHENQATGSEDVDEGRRDALLKIACFAAYTAPALLGMLSSNTAQATSYHSGSGYDRHDDHDDHGGNNGHPR